MLIPEQFFIFSALTLFRTLPPFFLLSILKFLFYYTTSASAGKHLLFKILISPANSQAESNL